MPYSCQLQFGTSGSKGTPVGAGNTCRAIGLEISQTSRLTMVQTTRRAPPGSFRGGGWRIGDSRKGCAGAWGRAWGDTLKSVARQGDYAALGLRGASLSSAITESVFITWPNAVRMQASPASCRAGPSMVSTQ